MPGPPTDAIHGVNRLTRTSCPLSPCLSALFKKISTPSDRHRGVMFRLLWAFCILKIFQKPVTLPRAISFIKRYLFYYIYEKNS